MQTKIDCSIAENYIKEFKRMCESKKTCGECKIRGLSGSECRDRQSENTEQGIEIVQAWSDEHPIEPVVTYLDKLKEVFPKVHLGSNETPSNFCPNDLGLEEIGGCSSGECIKCWSQPYKGE